MDDQTYIATEVAQILTAFLESGSNDLDSFAMEWVLKNGASYAEAHRDTN